MSCSWTAGCENALVIERMFPLGEDGREDKMLRVSSRKQMAAESPAIASVWRASYERCSASLEARVCAGLGSGLLTAPYAVGNGARNQALPAEKCLNLAGQGRWGYRGLSVRMPCPAEEGWRP